MTESPSYRTGCMPNTDFKYEEFEGLLGSFYLSLLPLKDSSRPEDREDYQSAIQVLNYFAKQYEVQSPEEVVKNPRTKNDWAIAHVMPSSSTLDMVGSFIRDFGVGGEARTPDRKNVCLLGRTVLSVLGRYGVVELDYDTIDGKNVPVKCTNLDWTKGKRTLADILSN